MAAAFALFFTLIPLYVTVALGWVAGRYLQASGRHIAGIMLYIVTPAVVFGGVMNAPLSPEVILLPLVTFTLCTLIGVVTLLIGQRWLDDDSTNILPLAAGSGNTGYFGIP